MHSVARGVQHFVGHLAHEVTNIGSDRGQLRNMASQAKEALGVEELEVVADHGYFKGEEIMWYQVSFRTGYLGRGAIS